MSRDSRGAPLILLHARERWWKVCREWLLLHLVPLPLLPSEVFDEDSEVHWECKRRVQLPSITAQSAQSENSFLRPAMCPWVSCCHELAMFDPEWAVARCTTVLTHQKSCVYTLLLYTGTCICCILGCCLCCIFCCCLRAAVYAVYSAAVYVMLSMHCCLCCVLCCCLCCILYWNATYSVMYHVPEWVGAISYSTPWYVCTEWAVARSFSTLRFMCAWVSCC